MKGIFFAQINPEDTNLGAIKKVHDQVKAFAKCGADIRLETAPPLNSGLRSSFAGKGVLASVPFLPVFSKYDHNNSYLDCDFYYFRFLAADYPFISFLRFLKENNSKATIFVEHPTFPSTHWMKSVFHLGIRIKDIVARRKYKGLVDYFVLTRSDYSELYGVPVIFMKNGIDVSRIPVRTPEPVNDNEIHVIAVATMFPFHGFDRFINGMARYYANNDAERKVILHLVGNGPGKELPYYKDLVMSNKLEDYVVFEGELQGEPLDKLFNKCQIGLCSLGMFRHGLSMASSLKTREYIARGIPLISGCPIDVTMDADFPYELHFPNDESIPDINDVVSFYDGIYRNKTESEVINDIRQFANDYCDVSVVMNDILKHIVT